ncbi:hypothetical protein, partial [Klebsiella pneumoniae]|uniref:hypothetical protein n=1 Tax=Klebsiella pneumoniae TaxID=573 RepID=UPI0025A2C764
FGSFKSTNFLIISTIPLCVWGHRAQWIAPLGNRQTNAPDIPGSMAMIILVSDILLIEIPLIIFISS